MTDPNPTHTQTRIRLIVGFGCRLDPKFIADFLAEERAEGYAEALASQSGMKNPHPTERCCGVGQACSSPTCTGEPESIAEHVAGSCASCGHDLDQHNDAGCYAFPRCRCTWIGGRS